MGGLVAGGIQDDTRRRLCLRVLERHCDATLRKVAVTTPAAPCPRQLSVTRVWWKSHSGSQEHLPVAVLPRPEAGLAERDALLQTAGLTRGGRSPPPAPARGCRENPVLQRAPDLGAARSRTGHARLSPALAPVGGSSGSRRRGSEPATRRGAGGGGGWCALGAAELPGWPWRAAHGDHPSGAAVSGQ